MESDSIKEIEVSPTSLSDHDFITILISDVLKNPHRKKTVLPCRKGPTTIPSTDFSLFNFRKADFSKINEELEKVDWDKLKSEHTTESFPEVFHRSLFNHSLFTAQSSSG